jgi:hypothetical protein
MEGVCLDSIEEAISPVTPPRLMDKVLQDRWTFAVEFSRLLKFKKAIDVKLMESPNLTGVDSSLALARCLLFNDKLDPNEPAPAADTRFSAGFTLKKWEAWYRSLADFIALIESGEPGISAVINHPYTRNVGNLANRAFIITKRGYIGVGSGHSEVDDVVSIFSGAKTPFVLRRLGRNDFAEASTSIAGRTNEESWEIVGDCFLNDFMDNQVTGTEWEEKRQMLRIV